VCRFFSPFPIRKKKKWHFPPLLFHLSPFHLSPCSHLQLSTPWANAPSSNIQNEIIPPKYTTSIAQPMKSDPNAHVRNSSMNSQNNHVPNTSTSRIIAFSLSRLLPFVLPFVLFNRKHFNFSVL